MALASQRQPSSADETRQLIVNSLFSRQDADGTPEETLISYVKVHEEDSEGEKTRYIMLAVTKMGKCVLHKCKRNNNNTFSKGKTWHLEDMRVLECLGPVDFALTMTIRRYHWSTDGPKEQLLFLNSLVKVYRTYTKGELPQLINFNPTDTALNGKGPVPRTGASSSNSSLTSPPPHMIELQPPAALGRNQRSGSSSSMASSGPGSYYGQASEAGSVFSGRSIVGGSAIVDDHDQRTPTLATFGRSPMSESSFTAPMIARPSPAEAWAGAHAQRGYPDATGTLGRGPPPVRRQGSGDDRKASAHPTRIESGTSDYRDGSKAIAQRRPSAEMRHNTEVSKQVQEGAYSGLMGEMEIVIPPVPEETETTNTPGGSSVASWLPPVITTTMPSPSISSEPQAAPMNLADTGATNDEPGRIKRRASFHPQPLTTVYSRDVLLTSRTGVLPGAGITLEAENNTDAIMANVEEMIEGFDWTAAAGVGDTSRGKGSAEAIESRLLDELSALESANIHAFLESDDRVAQVLTHIDDALVELDDIDIQLTGYRLQLNAVSDDIAFIESQNRGLQVQTSNQHALLGELRQLLQITEVPQEDLRILLQESPSTIRGVQILEKAASSLYKALQAGRDTANEVAATIARMQEYKSSSAQFSTRMVEYLDITFKHQSDSTLAEYRKTAKKTLKLAPHTSLGEHLMIYEGLVLYVKEMDEDKYQRLCMNYITTITKLHQAEMKELLMNLIVSLNTYTQGLVNDSTFSSALNAGSKGSALARSKTIKRPTDSQAKGDAASHRVAELYTACIGEIVNQVIVEDGFINAFLHVADNESTFADYMELDTYFRRQAARYTSKGLNPSMAQIARSYMELTFGFIDGEFRNWVDAAIERNQIAIVAVIAITEKLAKEAEEEGTSLFLIQLFEKQLGRQRQSFDKFVSEQIRTIDAAKNQIKKRRGVVFFVRHFPAFVERIESQLADSNNLEIRQRVDTAYERVVASVLGSLQQVAKIVGAEVGSGEDKGQLYLHVVMIENLHFFVEEVSLLNVPALSVFLQRSKGLYEENMTAYTKILLRRSFARLMDFFDGVERLLKTTPANEISVHNNYSRGALRKVLKEYGTKDMRKAIETMGRRVDKHFSDEEGGGVGSVVGGSSATPDPGTAILIAKVWREVTNELVRETRRAHDLIGKSYPDVGLSLEYGPNDVEAACRRSKH